MRSNSCHEVTRSRLASHSGISWFSICSIEKIVLVILTHIEHTKINNGTVSTDVSSTLSIRGTSPISISSSLRSSVLSQTCSGVFFDEDSFILLPTCFMLCESHT